MKSALALYITNRVYHHLVTKNDYDALEVINRLQDELIDESVPPLDYQIIGQLWDISWWHNGDGVHL